MSIRDFALSMLSNNPNVKRNPQLQEFVNVIQSGDSVKGEQIATNLCNTYGVPKEKAINDAKHFFKLS